MFEVYVIYNKEAGKIYVGQTNDLKRRVEEHNWHTIKGFTARFRTEWILIYTESLATRSEALTRERQLKSGNGRGFIKQFIPK